MQLRLGCWSMPLISPNNNCSTFSSSKQYGNKFPWCNTTDPVYLFLMCNTPKSGIFFVYVATEVEMCCMREQNEVERRNKCQLFSIRAPDLFCWSKDQNVHVLWYEGNFTKHLRHLTFCEQVDQEDHALSGSNFLHFLTFWWPWSARWSLIMVELVSSNFCIHLSMSWELDVSFMWRIS